MSEKEILELDNIIEHPRKDHNPLHPEYQRDVYNMDEAIAQNKKYMGTHGRRNRIIATKINFADRKNNRKE